LFSAVIIDELWLFKNPKSIRTKNVAKLISPSLPALGLSGSMVTQGSLEDLYGQSVATGLAKHVAPTLTSFRQQFMVSYSAFGGLQWTAKKNALITIQQRLAPYVSINFPKATIETKLLPQTVEPTNEQRKMLTDVNQEYYILLDSGELEIKNAAVLLSKVQQISDGAILDSAGNATRIKSNKLQRTLELCSQLFDAGERVIIWCAFKASVDLLAESLGDQTTYLASHRKFDDEGWAKGKYKCCICTVGSGASINDFKNVQYAIVYSAPFSNRAVQQAFGRTNRKDSSHPIAYYYMMQTAETADKYVFDSLKITRSIEEYTISTSTQIVQQYIQQYDRI
jgi:hypothetical protein